MSNTVKFIDLFAGIGGIRKGFELACEAQGIECECVFTSEIKEAAIQVLKQNHSIHNLSRSFLIHSCRI